MPNATDLRAFCYASGHIRFGRRVPPGAILIATGGRLMRKTVTVLARHGYDNKTLLVPGIPEAPNEPTKLAALAHFCNELKRRLDKKARAA